MNTANLNQIEDSSQSNKSIKVLLFPVGNLNFAFHVDCVQKIINYATIFGSGLNHFGLVNIGDREITVLDLHKKLFNTPQLDNSEDKKYLILVKNSVDELFGIVIHQTPSLFDILLNTIRIIPPSYRQADTLKIASHVTLIETENGESTTFILDPDELITPIKEKNFRA